MTFNQVARGKRPTWAGTEESSPQPAVEGRGAGNTLQMAPAAAPLQPLDDHRHLNSIIKDSQLELLTLF